MTDIYELNKLNHVINDITNNLVESKSSSLYLKNNSLNILENIKITDNLINDTIKIYYKLRKKRERIIISTNKLRNKMSIIEEVIYPLNRSLEEVLIKQNYMKKKLTSLKEKTNLKSYYYEKIPKLFNEYLKNKKDFLESTNEYKNYKTVILPNLRKNIIKFNKLNQDLIKKNVAIKNIETRYSNIKNMIRHFYNVSEHNINVLKKLKKDLN